VRAGADARIERARTLIRDVADFPRPGIVFKDITPLLADPQAYATVVDALVDHFLPQRPDRVLGIEARGFILAAPVAYRLGAGFVPARKRGKLPSQTTVEAYELEYGVEELELHEDAAAPGERVLIVDDVLATGGTARAAANLVAKLGAEVVGIGVVVELAFLSGRERFEDLDVFSLITF
jgi:adenine phosphoribosyltransferase